MFDVLVDRDCVLLDGRCKCKTTDDCKYLKEKLHGTEQEPKVSPEEGKEVQQEGS